MEMGDFFYWTQAIGRGPFEASHDAPSQHRLPGLHLPGRYQRDLRQRSRKGRLFQQSHTIMSTLVSDWRGANAPSCPIMHEAERNGAHGYNWAGNTLHPG
jgi:hypothetical protein